MTEEQTPFPGAAEESAAQPQFQMQKIYVKDVSFELPSAPEVFEDDGAAEIKLNLSQRVNTPTEGIYEVVLAVTVTATTADKTAYLAEVHQAGLFTITGLEDSQLQGLLNVLCPQTLFPYASQTVTTLVAAGGFPPLVLQPINFENVYRQRLEEAQAKAGAAADDMEVQGNA